MWQLDGKNYWSSTEVLVPGDTLPRMFWNAQKTRGDGVIFRQKRFGLWQSITWRQLADLVREIGGGLIELGFEPGETVSILGNTREEWLMCDLGALCAGGRGHGVGGSRPRGVGGGGFSGGRGLAGTVLLVEGAVQCGHDPHALFFAEEGIEFDAVAEVVDV